MSTKAVPGKDASSNVKAATVDMKFELIVIPVSDIDRAKEFYSKLGWRLDAEFAAGDDFRIMQFTPPGSGCSIIFGKNVTPAAPGSVQGMYLIVSDIEAARREILSRGVEISEVFHGGAPTGTDEPYLFGRNRLNGPDPEHASYRSFASFKDPDGNGWLLQEVTTRQPGRINPATTTFASVTIWPTLFVARRPPMASMRSAPADSATKTGQPGTPPTWWPNSPEGSCRNKQLRQGRHRQRARPALHW